VAAHVLVVAGFHQPFVVAVSVGQQIVVAILVLGDVGDASL